MAKVVRFHAFGGPDVLRVEDVDVGEPGCDEVRIRVHAIGLNRVDSLYRGGNFLPAAFPSKIGYEAAGIIEAVGPGVTGFGVGDRVAVLYGLSMQDYGTYGEAILYPGDRLIRVPDGQSLVEAAASWMQYGTAYALVAIAGIGAGDPVVITAASSSVGLAAIQIASAHRAVPIAVTTSAGKAAALKAHGAAHVLVSTEEDVAARIREITSGEGARIIFDAVGGAPLATLLGAAASEAVAVVYGTLAGASIDLFLPLLMMNNVTLRGWSADLFIRQDRRRSELIDYVNRGIAAGTLRPVIDRTFDLSDIAAAHAYLESNAQLGKIVVTTSAAEPA
jgi:NADPH:quinone reductase-like Zn-dependent oxidoreductase